MNLSVDEALLSPVRLVHNFGDVDGVVHCHRRVCGAKVITNCVGDPCGKREQNAIP